MAKWNKNNVLENLAELLRETKCNDQFLFKLVADGVLSQLDIQLIKNYPEGYARNYTLYDVVIPKIRNVGDAVTEALKNTNQSGAAVIFGRGRVQ